MPRQRRGMRGDVGIAPYVPSTESVCVSHRADSAVRLYTRLPKTHALFIRADVGIRPYEITGKPVRHPFGVMRSSRPTKRAADECP